MNYFHQWQDYAGSQPEKFHKATIWQGEHAMVGLNCLEPGQTQKVHAHEGSDKFYFVLEGAGRFTVGDAEQEGTAGALVIAPAGIPHGVTNHTTSRLSMLVSISPPIK